MSIENRNLKAGTVLVAKYKGKEYRGLVVEGPDGVGVAYVRAGAEGKTYKSPSALGTSVTGKSCNGWAFWSVAGTDAAAKPNGLPKPTATERARKRAEKVTARNKAMRSALDAAAAPKPKAQRAKKTAPVAVGFGAPAEARRLAIVEAPREVARLDSGAC